MSSDDDDIDNCPDVNVLIVFVVYSGFVEPDEENELPSPKKIIENEMLNFFRQAQAELEEMLGKVPNNISSVPRIPSYGTADLNMLRMA